uniref:phenylalanine--tRNA ligase n=1 Tax=Spermothamnion repens TaxID=31383 RepID=A0A4D6WYH8_9FLOR|nr:Phenylalanine-tRNA ligase beta subunit [Spermothamnion repens]
MTLSGFETNKLTDHSNNQDYIIDIDITSNRKDTSNVVGMAKEISIIFNIPLKIVIFNTYQYISKPFYQNNNIHNIKYFRSIYITKVIQTNTPVWLKKYIKLHSDSHSMYDKNNLLNSIKQYIKIKWGNNIYYFDGNKPKNIKALKEKQYDYLIKNTINYTNNDTNNKIILCMFINDNNIENQHPYHLINSYNDTIQLLSTYSKCTIGKLSEQNYNLRNQQQHIKLNKVCLYNILGPIISKQNNTLTVKQHLKILSQLQLQPSYKKKIFKLHIPSHRQIDLMRDIDITEEIARIYGFNNFIDKIPYKHKKGYISKRRLLLKKVKNILCYLGLNEVINSSIVKQDINMNTLTIYNPMTEEQTSMRSNLLENLINNYTYNIKQKNYLVEMFEVGKTFSQTQNKINEKIEVSGILYNPNYIRSNWEKNTEYMNWFHAKGIIENFFEQLESNIYLQLVANTEIKTINYLKSILNPHKTMGIYNQVNDNLIGIFAQINNLHYKNLRNNQLPYIFSIDLDKLLLTIKSVNHFNYIIKPYSSYPSITRDISIHINNQYNILKIKKCILYKYKELVESIKVVNFYRNSKSKSNILCLRITYRSLKTTLENHDINNIHEDIESIIHKIA